MALRVYNTLTRQKELFATVQPGKVGMYLCGPTVYKPSHVGHMVGPVIFDTVKRYLTYLGYQVTFVVNITDVDDKLIVQSREQGTTMTALAERVTADYCQQLVRLGVDSIDHFPRATAHITDIQKMIARLIEKGAAYASEGDVYFDVTKDEDYGKLCNRDPAQLEAGARIEVSDRKRNPGDFALWKGAKPGEPQWDSPWGPGRPGWHIECSAMSMKLLGETLDIHGGGLDLQFPHHENELAQSETYSGKPFARFWMHNGLLNIGGEKVSKTNEEEQKKKATLVVSELLKQHRPETLRFFLLATQYRHESDFGNDRLLETERALQGFYRFFERYERISGSRFQDLDAPKRSGDFNTAGAAAVFLNDIARHRAAFLECMDDDFNTGGGIGCLYELLKTLNRFADAENLEDAKAAAASRDDFRKGVVVLKELSQILGIFRPQKEQSPHDGDKLLDQVMQLLIELRAEARKQKNFAMADQIRQRLTQLGVTLEDRAGGTGWRRNV
jgi:cysteinyl-tRNA synthetase